MHSLLERQLRRTFGTGQPRGPEWDRFCEAIDSAYRESDVQRHMVERSLTLMSEDLSARNSELSRQLHAVAEQARVLEHLHDAALVLDRSGRVLECYAATSELFGIPAESLVGRSFEDLVRPIPGGQPHGEVVEALRRRGRWSGDAVYLRRDGSEGLLATTLSVFRVQGRTQRRVLAVAQEVTERRRTDQQLLLSQKLDAIGQLAAGVAHEINTPAQYVTDNLRFLEDAFDSLAGHCDTALVEDSDLRATAGEIRPAIQQSLEGMRRIAEIVRGIKLFAHPGSGEKAPVDLNHEVESTLAVSRNEWKYVAEMNVHLDPNLPLPQGFPGEIGHVVLNLVVNAAHAIAEATENGTRGKGHITVATAVAGNHVEIRVSDDGPGIRPEIQSRIFEPFFTTKPVGKGTGQGLALSQRIVREKHGGTLHFESTPGKGATFIVSLPLGTGAATAATAGRNGLEDS